LKSGAGVPAAGSSPLVWIGFPFSVTVAMGRVSFRVECGPVV
jgi:hypothetical protein